jgi:coatomer subunit beta
MVRLTPMSAVLPCGEQNEIHTGQRVYVLQILICQNLRNNLQHPNEYLRGVTLRFLCRIREEDILEPLVPAILSNLEHRHSFVRRNAVLCLNELYKLPKGELLFQDAPEMIAAFLETEQDVSARRNALMFLTNHDPDRAINFLSSHADKLIDWGAILQMAVVELIRKVLAVCFLDAGLNV